MTALPARMCHETIRRYVPALGATLRWGAVLLPCLLLGELAEAVGVPAPQLLVGVVVGAVLALTGVVRRELPRPLTRGSQALIGALMGSYLNLDTLHSVAASALPLSAITVLTVGVCFAVAFGLSKWVRLSLPDSLLGMTPGGSAAIVASAGELGADTRLVAFTQYLRVGLVALTAPLLAIGLPSSGGHGKGSVTAPGPLHLVDAHSQIPGLLVLVAICLLGTQLGRRFSLPAPVLLGSMLVAAVAVASQGVSGFVPDGALRGVVFAVVGLEVGLRFTRPALRHVGRLLPVLLGATVLVCLVCAGLAWLLADAIGMPFLEAYLATTPGGINAVLATADATGVNAPVVAAVQSARLFAMCLLTPMLVRRLAKAGAAARRNAWDGGAPPATVEHPAIPDQGRLPSTTGRQ